MSFEERSRLSKAAADKRKLLKLIAGDNSLIREKPEMKSYLQEASEYFLARGAQLAHDIGQGYLAPDIWATLAAEARALMWSNYYTDRVLPELALKHAIEREKFADSAFNRAQKYAKDRPKSDESPADRIRNALDAQGSSADE